MTVVVTDPPGSIDLLAAYRTMLTIRRFEEAAARALADGLVLGVVHPYIGQEAIAVGVMSQLTADDRILSTHRGHGHAIAKGAPVEPMMRELFGRVGGLNGGKGGSVHVADFSVGMLGANGVVAANLVVAAGVAHGLKLTGSEHVAVCFFGDGATNRGPFFEALNWAAVFELPLLFVCEDNGYAATTSTRRLTAGGGPSARAGAFGLTTLQVDGNDPQAVARGAAELLAGIRRDGRPAFLHATTYRLTGHTASDPGMYRPEGEVDGAWKIEPLVLAAQALLAGGVTAEELATVEREVEALVAAACETAAAAPYPDASEAYTDVQTDGSPAEEAF